MAASKSTIPFSPAFQQILQSVGIDNLIRRVDQVMSANIPVVECSDQACPILGLHNTDECADLIAQAREEGTL